MTYRAEKSERPGVLSPGQLIKHTDSASSIASVTPAADRTRLGRITSGRVRIPVSLLYSRAHSGLAVTCYGLVDMLTDRQGPAADPCSSGRDWMAARLHASVSGLEKALGMLSRAHTGDADEQDHPAYLATRRRSYRRTAVRVPRQLDEGEAYVDVPTWTLGDLRGPLVSHDDWRLYATYRQQARESKARRYQGGSRAVAMLLGRKADSIGPALARLEAAGLVVVARRRGRSDVVLPLTERLSAEERESLEHDLGRSCGYVGVPSQGASGVPSQGASGVPSEGGSLSRDTAFKTQRFETQGSPPRPLSPSGITAAPSLAVPVVEWCGRCSHPRQRFEIDPDTGAQTRRPCPTCGGGDLSVRSQAA
jgi:hypothetical protein